MKPARSAWKPCSARTASTPPADSFISRTIPIFCCITRKSKDGQILEEGITEAGSMAEFTAAGTAYANYGVDMIPFFIYYSMFGFQRVGDLIWAFADSRGKGFLLGGTAGRTTLSGEGLQHQDGHSLLLASTVPTLAAYDPRMPMRSPSSCTTASAACIEKREDHFLLHHALQRKLSAGAMPEGVGRRHPQGHLSVPQGRGREAKASVQLFGSGSMLTEAMKAQEILAEKYASRPMSGA